MANQLKTLMPFFKNSSDSVNKDFEQNHILKKIPGGQFIVMEGDDCNYLPIVKSGQIRVYKLSPSGQEITLYRIKPGETCILTISCLITKRGFPAVAFTERESEVILVSAETIKNWVNKYQIWREFLFDYMANIIFKVLSLLESSTFSRTEARVIDFLIQKFEDEGIKLNFTHQHIASEIGTSREVVSRILKELETREIIKLSRGSISILKKDELKRKNSVIA